MSDASPTTAAADTTSTTSATDSSLAGYLREHPRMMGVLFTTCLLLSQTAPAAAAFSGCRGP
jgi:hypothetical protein